MNDICAKFQLRMEENECLHRQIGTLIDEIKVMEQRTEYAEAQATELTAENRSLYEQLGRKHSKDMRGDTNE